MSRSVWSAWSLLPLWGCALVERGLWCCETPGRFESASKLDALHALREIPARNKSGCHPIPLDLLFIQFDAQARAIIRHRFASGNGQWLSNNIVLIEEGADDIARKFFGGNAARGQ